MTSSFPSHLLFLLRVAGSAKFNHMGSILRHYLCVLRHEIDTSKVGLISCYENGHNFNYHDFITALVAGVD
jgi:hypothetical protein